MSKTLKIGIVGLVHDHVWETINQFRRIKEANVVCVSDKNKPLLDKAKEFVPRRYESFEQMLSKESLDAICVYTENSRHALITQLAAEKGLHIMVEKPMAATLEQAENMLRISRRYGIKLMINYPTAWYETFREAYTLAKNSLIGRVYQVRYRAAHQGPKEIGCSPYFYEWLYNKELSGSGAFMDYCCYGANMSIWILGLPEKAVALGGTYVRDYLTVEDNAILLMGYEKGMGIAEASWSQIGEGVPPKYTLVLNGSEGVITAGKQLRFFTKQKGEWETVNPNPLGQGRKNGPDHFTNCILEEKPFDSIVTAVHNRDTQCLLEAGLISMRENRTVFIKELGIER